MIPKDKELRPQIPNRIRQILAEPLVQDAAKLVVLHLGEIRLKDFFALVPRSAPPETPPAPNFSIPPVDETEEG